MITDPEDYARKLTAALKKAGRDSLMVLAIFLFVCALLASRAHG